MRIVLDDNDLRQAFTLWVSQRPELNEKYFAVEFEVDVHGVRVVLIEIDPPTDS